MNEVLKRNLFLVKEHVGLFKAANNYDIYDPESGQIILECREEKLGFFTRIFRFTRIKRFTRFDIQLKTPDGRPVVRVKRGVAVFLSRVDVLDDQNRRLGAFKQKLFSVGGSFDVLDEQDMPICYLKGKWTSWDFRFLSSSGEELARVAKKWAGLGKEFFTSADNYMLEIKDTVPEDSEVRPLILAAVMCIDMVLKE